MPTWDDDPFGPRDLVVTPRLTDSRVPGSEEAMRDGCFCPGDVGDLDQWSQPGLTLDNACPLHGREARRRFDMEAREAWIRRMQDLEETEELEHIMAHGATPEERFTAGMALYYKSAL